MDAGFIALVNTILEKGLLTDTTLMLIIIVLLGYGFRYLIKPIYTKIQKVPTTDYIDESLDKNYNKEEINFELLSKKLEKLTEMLDEVEDLERASHRDVLEVRRDIEHIKEILNQFQGHMLYSGGRRQGDFGNRELK